MKKLFALILAICLSVTVLSALAEEGDVIGYYPDDHPESKVFMSTWVAEGGNWRIEMYGEDGSIKPYIVHRLGDNKEDIWEYATELDKDNINQLTAEPVGLHYKQDTVSGNWDTTYYEDGNATFVLNENGKLIWNDLKKAWNSKKSANSSAAAGQRATSKSSSATGMTANTTSAATGTAKTTRFWRTPSSRALTIPPPAPSPLRAASIRTSPSPLPSPSAKTESSGPKTASAPPWNSASVKTDFEDKRTVRYVVLTCQAENEGHGKGAVERRKTRQRPFRYTRVGYRRPMVSP